MDDFPGYPVRDRKRWHFGISSGTSSVPKTNHKYTQVPLKSARSHRKQLKDFKPFAHRTISLTVLAILVLGLVGALEYCMHVLPQSSSGPSQNPNNSVVIQERSERRQIHPRLALYSEKKLGSTTTQRVFGGTISGSIAPTTPETAYLNPVSTLVAVETRLSPCSAIISFVQDVPTVIPAGQVVTTTLAAGTSRAPQISNNSTSKSFTSSGSHSYESMSISVSPAAPAPSKYLVPSASSVSVHLYTSAFPYDPQCSSGSSPLIILPPDYKDSPVPLTLVLSGQNYFYGIYLPVLAAVLVRLALSYLHRSTKLVDPFFMLTQAEGVAAYDFFRADHLGSESFLAPYHAFRSRRWLMLWSSVTYAAAQLLTPFATELAFIFQSVHIYNIPEGFAMVVGQALWVNPIIGRLLQGLLLFIFIMIALIGYLLRDHNTGIATNPASIATIASLVDHPTVSNDFSMLDQNCSKNQVAEYFSGRRYKLESYFSSDGTERYGIVPLQVTRDHCEQFKYATLGPVEDHTSISNFQTTPNSAGASTDCNVLPSKRPRAKRIIPLLLLTSTTITLFGVIVAYTVNSAATSFEAFMDSDSFGPRFVISILGLLIKSPLLSLCAKATASIPFDRLAERPRFADLDLLPAVPVTPLGAIWYSLRRQSWFAAALAVSGGVLVECLLIVLPGVPFHKNEIYSAAVASWYVSLSLLSIFLLVALAGWIRMFRREPEYQWPLRPTRIGAVCAYVAGTKMAAHQAGSLAAAAKGPVKPGQMEDLPLRQPYGPVTWAPPYDFKLRGKRWVVEFIDVPLDEEKIGQHEQNASSGPQSYAFRDGMWVAEPYARRIASPIRVPKLGQRFNGGPIAPQSDQ